MRQAGSLWHKIAGEATPRTSPPHRGGPVCSRLTSQAERELLAAEVSTSSHRPGLRDIPVRSLLTSGPVTGLVVANVAIQWAATHTSLLLPQYLNDVLHLPLQHTSLVAALPYLGSCLLGLLSTLLDSRLVRAGLTRTSVRKLCSSLCLFGFAGLSVAVPFLNTSTSLTVILTTAAYSMTGFRSDWSTLIGRGQSRLCSDWWRQHHDPTNQSTVLTDLDQ